MAKKKSNKGLIIGLLVIVAALIVLVVIKSQSRPKGEEVELSDVETRIIKETVTASGKVFPEKEVKISSDVSGEIIELFVEEGDSVLVGQLLARIDPEVFASAVERGEASVNNSKSNLAIQKASVQSSKAQIEQIEAQLENAKRIHERNIELREDGVISVADFEASEANVSQLEANLRASQANYQSSINAVEAAEFTVRSSEASLKELKTNLSRTTIVSPTNGIISNLSVEQGERVVGTIQMTGTEMMRIANFNSMEVQVEVSENDILRVSLGDSVDVEVDAYLEEIFKGDVTEIANSAMNSGSGAQLNLTSDQVTNFVVKIRLRPESYQHLISTTGGIPFRPGMSASVDIYTDAREDALAIPIQAVTVRDFNKDKDGAEEDDREVVFVFDADTARMVEVVTGIQDNEYIVVESGIEADMKIVSGPYSAISRKLESGDALVEKKEDKKKSNSDDD